jgi:hypothetical protein
MRVSAVFEGLWLVKKAGGKLIRNSFEIPHDTIPSNVKATLNDSMVIANYCFKIVIFDIEIKLINGRQ